jgi:ApaG protein
MTIYSQTTNAVHVVVEPRYEKERSKPEQALFVFSYRVRIRNDGDESIQINSRSWVITDAYFNIEYVEGEGVMGEQPIILPGQTFSYSSFCPLKTSFGSMRGYYYGVTGSGKRIKINIPEFILAHPFAIQ